MKHGRDTNMRKEQTTACFASENGWEAETQGSLLAHSLCLSPCGSLHFLTETQLLGKAVKASGAKAVAGMNL